MGRTKLRARNRGRGTCATGTGAQAQQFSNAPGLSTDRHMRSTAVPAVPGMTSKKNPVASKSYSQPQPQEDLSSKVKRLEGMVVRLQNKIEEILDSLLSHRSERIAARAQLNEILDREEEVRLSVVQQLKSCLNGTGGDARRSENKQQPGSGGVAQRSQSYQRMIDTEEAEIQGFENVDVGIVIKTEPGNDQCDLDEAESESEVDEEQCDMEIDDDSDYVPEPSAFVPRNQTNQRTPAQKPRPAAPAGTTSKKKIPNYQKTISFPDRAKADDHVRAEGAWKEGRSATTINGTKIHYNCKACSSCPVKMYLFFEKPGAEIHQYITQNEHDHSHQPEPPGPGPGHLQIPNSRPQSELRFVTSMKGNEMVVADDYIFIRQSINKSGTQYYRCSQRNVCECKARLALHPDGTFVQKPGHIGHLPNPERIEAYRMRASMKQMARSSTGLEPAEVMSQVESMLLLNNDQGINVGSMIGSKDSLRRTIRRLQQKARTVTVTTTDTVAKHSSDKSTDDQDQDVNVNEGSESFSLIRGQESQGTGGANSS